MRKELHEFCNKLAEALKESPFIQEISFECDKSLIGTQQDLIELTLEVSSKVSSITVFEVISKEKVKITIVKKTEGK